ncbi:DNA polymerase delta, subunit 4 [Exidia glandulosa HHB12029]|uniref:DNA polymerase delta, subunit 4 n=1 Tax=Exidia glandulosa HHB12029 TaxID=1314781 RepID=A0A165C373_EXIGL|nr:DNA polymerase delta, subunit 4 [Exidia glandulosa HHB12029]KZV98709.1 DNA polymerase delta, subunit 4 [Exidia glandulosa HHB12029]
MTTSKTSKKTSTSASTKQSKLGFAPSKAAATRAAKGKGKNKKRIATPPSSSDDDDQDVELEPAVPRGFDEEAEELKLNDAQWLAPLAWANAKTEKKSTIHSKSQNKIDHILRVFDNSHEYGPCVGLTRMQRWERAQNMGMDPPQEIRDILLTRQGAEETRYSQTCFYGEV